MAAPLLRRLFAAWDALSGTPAYREALSGGRKRHTYVTRLHADSAQFGSTYTEPILQMTQHLPGQGLMHDTQMLLWHAMRQYSPTLDAAIRNRRTLEGGAVIESEDEGLAAALNAFWRTVPVGYLGARATLVGGDNYLSMLADNADEYGLAVGEILTDEAGREVRRLVAPNMRTISMHDENRDGLSELFQTQRGTRRRIDNEPLVQVMSLSYATEGPWPCPLAWSAVKSTEAVMRMFESVINGWWRFGDPSLMMGMEFDKDAAIDTTPVLMPDGTEVDVPSALLLMRNTVQSVMASRRDGRAGDAYASVQGGKLVNEVLGSVDAGLMRHFKEQSSVFDGHIIALSRTPVWMYPSMAMRAEGLGSDLSNNEALIASVDALKRNTVKERIMREVLDTFLVLSGDARQLGRYTVVFESASILDDKAQADADLTQAQADAAVIENVVQTYDEKGQRRFTGEAERVLEEKGIYMETAQ